MEGLIVKNMSFKVGRTLTLVGRTKPDPKQFQVNIKPAETDIAICVNPRFAGFAENQLVACNSYQGGKWFEEKRVTDFPFKQGEEFKISITFHANEFLVVLPDGFSFTFPNHLGMKKYSILNVVGDARITRIEIP